jgi:hypothetical protein
MIASAKPEAARAVHAIVTDYRARLAEIVERAALPHLLPTSNAEAYREVPLGVTADRASRRWSGSRRWATAVAAHPDRSLYDGAPRRI